MKKIKKDVVWFTEMLMERWHFSGVKDSKCYPDVKFQYLRYKKDDFLVFVYNLGGKDIDLFDFHVDSSDAIALSLNVNEKEVRESLKDIISSYFPIDKNLILTQEKYGFEYK